MMEYIILSYSITKSVGPKGTIYSSGFKNAVIGHFKKKKGSQCKIYSKDFKTVVIGLQYEKTHSDGSKTGIIGHLQYK